MDGDYGDLLAAQQHDVAQSTPAGLNTGRLLSRPGSLPVITVTGDHNSNTVLSLGDKRACSDRTLPLGPPPYRREGRVKLPARYQQKLEAHQRRTNNNNVGLQAHSETRLQDRAAEAPLHPGSRSLGSLAEHEVSSGSPSTSDRFRDLETSLKWIKQEMVQIKQEDRFLMRRLLDLRARLHQLQGMPSHMSLSSNLALLGSCGSDMDIATWTSFLSLDEDALDRNEGGGDTPGDLGGVRVGVETAPPALREVIQGFQDHLASYGPSLSSLSRSVSSREALRPPPTKIRRKKSLPMANELEEDHFFDDDD